MMRSATFHRRAGLTVLRRAVLKAIGISAEGGRIPILLVLIGWYGYGELLWYESYIGCFPIGCGVLILWWWFYMV